MGHFRVTAIHNQTRPPVKVRYPKADGTELVIRPGKTARGPWIIRFNSHEHAALAVIPKEVELWFTESATEFTWGSETFGDGRLPLTGYLRIDDELEVR